MRLQQRLHLAALALALGACGCGGGGNPGAGGAGGGGGGGGAGEPGGGSEPPAPPPPAAACDDAGYPAPAELAPDCVVGGTDWIAFVYARGPATDPTVFLRKRDGTCGLRVAGGAEYDYGPAFARGGLKLAYASTRDGINRVYLRDLAAGTESKLEAGDSMAAASPAISPDGFTVAFEGTAGGNAVSEIYTAPIAGGAPTKIPSGAVSAQPAWSPDGSYLYFVTYRAGYLEIVRTASDGSGLTQITTGSRIQGKFAVTPDGAGLVYARLVASGGATKPTELVYQDIATKAIRVVSSSNEGDPDVSADGTQVAVSRRTDTGYELFLLDLDTGEELRQLTSCGGVASAAAFAR